MSLTKTFAVSQIALGVVLCAGMANAQAMSFRGIDVNQDGVLDLAELETVFGANAELAMDHYDINRDGVVEVDEATKVSLRGVVTSHASHVTSVEDNDMRLPSARPEMAGERPGLEGRQAAASEEQKIAATDGKGDS